MVPEAVAFDRRLVGARRNATAVADLGLGTDAAVAEQRAGVVAAAHGVIAGREFLEAEDRLPGILGAQPQGQGQPGDGAELAVTGEAEHGRIGLAVEAARRDLARADAIDCRWSAIGSRAEGMETLPEFEQAGDMPR